MDVERLIKLVKKHVFLYDISHKDYKNTGLKVNTWENIAEELNQNVSDVRHKWKTVKDGYMKYKKQVEGSTGLGKKVCEYVWKNHLMFLDNYNVSRKGLPVGSQEFQVQQGTISTSPMIETDNCSSTASASLMSSPSRHNSDNSLNTEYIPPTFITVSRPITEGPPQNAAKRQKVSEYENNVDKVLHYLSTKQENDAVSHLFISYAKTFKKLTTQQQAHIKIEMAKLFAYAELEMVYNVQEPISDTNYTQYQVPITHTTESTLPPPQDECLESPHTTRIKSEAIDVIFEEDD